MRNIITRLSLLIIGFLAYYSVTAQEQIHLFTDKSFAVSGDTLWFQVFIHGDEQAEISQVIHIQLDDKENRHIHNVTILCKGNFGDGFITVPDSLSTGLYSLKAFSHQQRSKGSSLVNQKFIIVYNRFSSEINSIESPAENVGAKYKTDNQVEIKTDNETYKRGDNVQVTFSLPQTGAGKYKKIWATAGISDPLSEQFLSTAYPVQLLPENNIPVSLVEKNGILISGRVFDVISGEPVQNAIVFFSIPDSIPFFDYCISDINGAFNFYLRNAVGTADFIFQAMTKYEQECRIELSSNFIKTSEIQTSEKYLDFNQALFIDEIIKSSYFEKLFSGYTISSTEYFSMPQQFEHPFYGEPSKTFDPNLFIDLPDFQEISREILNGVQYRDRRDGITIRLLNLGNETIFDREPLKLLDGIPVFNNEVFKPMATEDILKVDAVFYERFFGDLTFPGILSVYSKKRSVNWVDNNPKITRVRFDCLQPPQNIGFINERIPNTHVPDLNKVLFRQTFGDIGINNQFSFHTSDITGIVNIRLILIDDNNQVYYSQKTISVE